MGSSHFVIFRARATIWCLIIRVRAPHKGFAQGLPKQDPYRAPKRENTRNICPKLWKTCVTRGGWGIRPASATHAHRVESLCLHGSTLPRFFCYLCVCRRIGVTLLWVGVTLGGGLVMPLILLIIKETFDTFLYSPALVKLRLILQGVSILIAIRESLCSLSLPLHVYGCLFVRPSVCLFVLRLFLLLRLLPSLLPLPILLSVFLPSLSFLLVLHLPLPTLPLLFLLLLLLIPSSLPSPPPFVRALHALAVLPLLVGNHSTLVCC